MPFNSPSSVPPLVAEGDGSLAYWWIEAFLKGTVPLPVLGLRLVAALVFGLMVAGIHFLCTGKEWRQADRSFSATLVLLSLLIAFVTMVIGDELARAFSLVGALAIVRFRTVVADTRDTAFVIFSVAAGMSAGTGFAWAALMCAPLVLLGGWLFRNREEKAVRLPGLLLLRMGAGRLPGEALQAAIREHVGESRLISLATVRGGAALDLTYSIRLPEPENVIALVNALSKVEGVQSVEVKED